MNQICSRHARWIGGLRSADPPYLILATLTLALGTSSSLAQADADDLANRLGLSDLASYRAALSGRPAASGGSEAAPPPAVSFRELWDHPQLWAGQRVRIEGNVVRVFRQDAFGGFPPLAELWLATKTGDLFCTVFPQDDGATPTVGKEATEPGNQVTFTGTFLKTVRYAASDQARLAPLIVGDRPPQIGRVGQRSATHQSDRPCGGGLRSADPPDLTTFTLVLALLAAGVLAFLHLRPTAAARRRKTEDQAASEAALEFIGPEDAPWNGRGRS